MFRLVSLCLVIAAQGLFVSSSIAQTNAPLQTKASRPPQEKQFPTDVSWVAVSLNGKSFTADRPTMILDQQLRVKGFGGCNTFSATAYPLRQQRFAVGPFALTKKVCAKNVMDLERAFLIALRAAQAWDLEGGRLVLKGQGGELRFERSI